MNELSLNLRCFMLMLTFSPKHPAAGVTADSQFVFEVWLKEESPFSLCRKKYVCEGSC